MSLFRVAAPAPTVRHVAATLLQTTFFWGLFLALLPWLLHALATSGGLAPSPFPGHRALGIALFASASVLGLGSGLTMAVRGRGTPLPLASARELVVAGPYRHVRNPMAVAGIAQAIGVGLWLADWTVVVYALAGAVAWHLWVRPAEERDLEQRFGERYRHYRSAVPLWRPRRSRYVAPR